MVINLATLLLYLPTYHNNQKVSESTHVRTIVQWTVLGTCTTWFLQTPNRRSLHALNESFSLQDYEIQLRELMEGFPNTSIYDSMKYVTPIWCELIGNGDTFERKASSHEHWRNSHHLVCCFWQSTDRKLEWWCYHVAVRPTIEGRRIPASCHFSKTSFRRVKATLLVINRCWRRPGIGIGDPHDKCTS